MEELGFWEAFWESDAILLIGIGIIFGTFDRIIELLIDLRDWFNPLFIINQFEEGVVLRWGVYVRTVKPGLHWRWPCSIEDYMSDTVVRGTEWLDVQSLTTKDGHSINSSLVLVRKVGNIKRWLLEVDDAADALHDIAYGLNEELTERTDLVDMPKPEFAEELNELIAEEALNWGGRILAVKFADKARSKSLRLWTGGASSELEG